MIHQGQHEQVEYVRRFVTPPSLRGAMSRLAIADQNPPPRRFIAGADAIAGAEQKIADLKAQIEADRGLSTSLAFD